MFMINEKKYSKLVQINEMMYQMALQLPMIELLRSPIFQNLLRSFYKAAEEQVNKKQCGWCLKPVKIYELTTLQKMVFYQSALCPRCEELDAAPIPTGMN